MLILSRRHGFTLPEIMISAVMTLIAGGAVYQLLITTQRLSRTQAEQLSLQSNVRTGALVVMSDLRESSTVAGGTMDKNDILSVGVSGITYRAMRGIGFLCQAPGGSQIRIGRNGFTGHRDPQAQRDSAYVFLEGSPVTGVDDRWLPVAITRVATAQPCPGASGPGITLTISNPALPIDLPVGAPVRIHEVMELKLYRTDGKSWLGARSVSAGEAVQPVLGPLSDGDGFHLVYLDGRGAPTNDLTAIQSIRFTVRGISEDPVRVAQGHGIRLEEALTAQVTLRNALPRGTASP